MRLHKTNKDNRDNAIKLCMVSTVAPEGGGVSTYTKNLVESFDPSNIELTILSQRNQQSNLGNSRFFRKSIKIVNCWNTGLRYPFQAFKELCRYKPQIVHVQHEYFIFGGPASAAFFPFFAVLTKFLRVKLIITLHGIVSLAEVRDPELSSIGNENLKGIPMSLSQLGMLLITRLIINTSDQIVVMNNTHRNVLIREYHCSPQKIMLVPHGVPQSKPIAQDEAKKRLGFDGLKVVLYFGYITKYKGIDILVKAFKNIDNPNSILLIGGAAHPRLKNNPQYKKFWDSLINEMSKDTRIKFIGFIPDDVLTTYISASDVVIFPYVASFSTGGPMNITLGHHKPVIASRVSSFSDILPECAIFKTGSVSDLTRILSKTLTDDLFKLELSKSTKVVAEERSWKHVAKSTSDLYYVLLNKQKS